MKTCPECKKTYPDDLAFCIDCGCNLRQPKKSNAKRKDKIIAVIIVAIIAVAGIFGLIQNQISATEEEIDYYEYARYASIPTTSDIKVNSNWTKTRRGDYIYIEGSVTNTSTSKTISYFEVQAKFYDGNGNVVDSEWTNDADDLAPGESRKFEIMHKYSYDEKEIKLSIKDVS